MCDVVECYLDIILVGICWNLMYFILILLIFCFVVVVMFKNMGWGV